MHADTQWLAILPWLGGLVFLLAVELSSRRIARHLREEERALICPIRRRSVSLTVVTDRRTGRTLGVRRCTAFTDPEDVRCRRECVSG